VPTFRKRRGFGGNWFIEGLDTKGLKEAKALLNVL
jgi:hypothetical protein